MWFCAYDPAGAISLITGIGAYANMNVMDGFAAVQHAGRQHNVRVSRTLRPRIEEMSVGPLRVDVLDPLQRLRLQLAPGRQGLSFDLEWSGFLPPAEESHHVGRLDGRAFQDYRRFDQLGRVTGWVTVEDERFDANRWFGVRDHAWGVRRGVGGFEPFTGTVPPEAHGLLFIWLAFATDELGGQLQIQEDGQGNRTLLDGHIRWPEAAARPVQRIVDATHEIEFVPGTRAYQRAVLVATTDSGDEWRIEAEPTTTAWAYVGTGYDNGFNDRKGLGAWRGSELLEHDTYDVTHPEDVVLPDGSTVRPTHREQPARLTVNGRPGLGHLPIMSVGRVERYGLGT